jgi:Na+:H+ antiporter, NhaA family
VSSGEKGRTLLPRGSWAESRRIAAVLRKETVGGLLLVAAAAVALVWANSPFAEAYASLRDLRVGPSQLHLDLTLGTWAADGLLAIFFFVVGLELKREFVAGDLRDPRRAALPIVAAVGGMAVPALLYALMAAGAGGEALSGWAVPTATDIAFALAVLAIVGTHLPAALRTFLLTLAVVDDLLAVIIIAVFYTDDLHLVPLLAAVLPLGLFTAAVQHRMRAWWVLLPLAAATWLLVHESGVHATIAGVLLGLAVPVRRRANAHTVDDPGLAELFEHRFRPLSAGVAVPVFAFFAAGVSLGGITGVTDALGDRVTLGIVVGLVVGKTVGILGTSWLVAQFTHARLDPTLRWLDLWGLSLLAGIGFTVSLLIGGLAFDATGPRPEYVKVAVLLGSLLAATLASMVLRARNRSYRRIREIEARDRDHDGVPDVYEEQD